MEAVTQMRVDSVSVAVHERGQGEVVLLLHGVHSDGPALLAHAAAMSEGFRLIAPDLPGFGRSDKPSGYLCSPEGYGAFAVRLARALGLSRYAVIGCGVGIHAARRAAERDPERVFATAALREPLCARVVFRRLLDRRQARSSRKLLQAAGWHDERPYTGPRFEQPGELLAFLRSALVGAAHAVSDERVDETVERAQADRLASEERSRRRLPVLNA